MDHLEQFLKLYGQKMPILKYQGSNRHLFQNLETKSIHFEILELNSHILQVPMTKSVLFSISW